MDRQKKTNYYANIALDRAAHLRKDESWLKNKLTDPATRFAPIWRSRSLIAGVDTDVGPWPWVKKEKKAQPPSDDKPPEPEPVFLNTDEHGDALGRGEDPVLLGIMDEQAYFAVDFSHIEDPTKDDTFADKGLFVDLRQVGALLPREQGALLAYARGMLTWNRNHLHCGRCGAPTVSTEAGHLRKCTNEKCDSSHFPRTDPAVIMLVTHGDKCLLGRQAAWPEGVYSTLAGFVEPGESLEDAVRREVFEESGARITNVQYHSSQPWPFPSSLMLGFHATAIDESLDVNTDELETAAWFSREWILENNGSGAFRMPRGDSIARQLIEAWLRQRP